MDDEKRYDVADILNEVQGNTPAQTSAPAAKKPFKLELDLDGEYGEAVKTAPVVREEQRPVHTPEEPRQPEKPQKKEKKKHGRISQHLYAVNKSGCLTLDHWLFDL